MRFRHKKIFISGVALTVAGVLGVGALLHTSVSVQASSAMMPGIETIVSETSQAEPFRILEIVDDTKDAEIGYYVSGQEPYIKLYEYTPDDGSQPIHFSSLEEGLSKLPTRELRQEFANNFKYVRDENSDIQKDENGNPKIAASDKIRDVREICYQPGKTDPVQGDEITDYPLTYEEYQERYFLKPDETEEQALAEGWKIVDLAETRKDVVKGNYVENPEGTGNYTKDKESYYPIRKEKRDGEDADGADTARYRENIQSFFSGESVEEGAPYNLVFEQVENDTIKEAFEKNDLNSLKQEYDYANGAYGYYENVYGDLTQSIIDGIDDNPKKYTFPGEASDPNSDQGIKVSLDVTNELSQKEGFAAVTDSFDDGTAGDSMTSDGSMEVYGDHAPADTQPSQNTSPSDDTQYEDNADDFSTGEVGSSMMGMSYVNGMDYTVMNATYGGQGYSAMKTSFEDDFSSEAGGFGDDSDTVPQESYSSESQEPDTYGQEETVTVPSAQGEDEDPDESGDGQEKENHGTVVGDVKIAGTQADPYVYFGEEIFEYPYYKYTPLGDLQYVKQKIEEVKNRNDNKEKNNQPVTPGDITVDDSGQYWYWTENAATREMEKQTLSVVAYRQAVDLKNIRPISEKITYNYYYRVKEVYFCCKQEGNASSPDAYTYYGWYYPTYPANEDVYIEVGEGDSHIPTHYISDATYTLTPGKGNYDFIPSDDAKEQTVEVNRIYYKGGYTNHDWLKRYVFHLSPDGEEGDTEEEKQQAAAEFNNFDIKVDTVTADKLSLDGTVTTTAADEVSAAAFYAEGDTEAFADDPGADMQDASSDTVDFQVDGSTEGEVTESEIIEGENASGQIPEAQSLEGQIAEGETSEVEPMVSESQEELEVFEDFDSAGESFVGEETDEAGFASEENTDEVTFFADSDSVEVAAVGSSGDSGNLPFSEYDLIYINTSGLKEEQAQVLVNLAGNKKAFIINQDKIGTDNPVHMAFYAYEYIKENDADQHYVTQNVYFFKHPVNTTGEPSDGTSDETTDDTLTTVSYLVNRDFHTDFNESNENGSSFTDGTAAVDNPVQGFEEILEYIASENQYRALGSDSSDEGITSGEASGNTSLLTTEISQARAVEYILNYRHKRVINNKPVINVLEIEPAKVSDSQELKPETVQEWLGVEAAPEIEKVYVCSAQSPGNTADKMTDNDINTFWHTEWGQNNCNKEPGHKHYISIVLDKPCSDIIGFSYRPRPSTGSGNINGIVKGFTVYLYDREVEGLQDNVPPEGYIGNAGESGEFYEDDDYTDRGEKIFTFEQRYNNVRTILIEITANAAFPVESLASCAELKILTPKVNITPMTASEYVGHIDDISSKYDMIYIGDSYEKRDNMIMGDGEMLYTHVGGVVLVDKNHLNKYELLGSLDIDYIPITPKPDTIKTKNGSQNVTLTQKLDLRTDYYENGVGSFRGSGNDMTRQQLNELMDFVKSGYPVILGKNLVRDNQVDETYVDNSSYYYQFLSQALEYDNVISEEELIDKKERLFFFSNLSKPKIDMIKSPPEAPRASDSNYAKKKNDSSNYLPESGLEYEFVVRNDSDAFPVNTTYDCKLYLDLNFDGNLSDAEEQQKYIEIRDEYNQVLEPVNGRYQLKIGGKYSLTRKIPDDYFKIITWKLELVSNTNENIRTSVMGYSKRKNNGVKVPIKILQITPANGIDHTTGNWNLEEDMRPENEGRVLPKNMKKVDDFDITFKEMTVTEYVDAYLKDNNLLDQYQMVIIGFDDCMQNISNEDAVKAIISFIKAGKSVIFSHDCTSKYNWDYKTTDIQSYKNDSNYKSVYNNWIWSTENVPDWGYYMNKYLRPISGLDRYGIANIDFSASQNSKATISDLIKSGQSLRNGSTVTVKSENVEVDFDRLETLIGDVAYATNSNRETSYLQTQGYINSQFVVDNDNNPVDIGGLITSSASKVNDGAITQYPFVIPNTISIARTHGQPYQLALEQDLDVNGISDGKNDIVVWYCLSEGTNNVYEDSPNDVRNNYYFYSKGNIIYTGSGHRSVQDDNEARLFINAMVAAANVTAVQPEVKFVKNLNPAAETEDVRYYMTDQAQWDATGNVLEKDMDFYFTVRDYNMVSASLSLEDNQQEDMTVQFFIQSEGENASGLTPEDGIGETVPEGKYENITKEVGPLTQYGSKNIVEIGSDGQFHLSQNSAYGFKIQDIEKYLYSRQEKKYTSSCPIYVRVTSTVTLYGKQTKKATWAKLDLKQRQLFDLD